MIILMKRLLLLNACLTLVCAGVFAQPKLNENNIPEVVKAMTAEEKALFVDTVFEVLEEPGAETLKELRGWQAYNAILQAIRKLDPEQHELVKEVIGHLEKRTTTDGMRINGVWIDVRNTQTFVYVDKVVTED